MSNQTLLILILFQLKHFLGDFPLQTFYMLGKGKPGLAFVLPLGAHCTVHMVLSGMIIACFKSEYLWLCVLEFIAHFVIDRIKATYKLPTGQWANEEKGKYLSKYYFAFGLDQMSHNVCYLIMAYIMGAI
jgi:hypothetical protein